MNNQPHIFYLLILITCLLFTNTLPAQQSFCSKHLVNSQKHLKTNKLKSALKELQEAQYCDTDNLLIDRIQEIQNKIFSALEKQKENAEAKQKCEDLLEENKHKSEEIELKSKILQELNDWMSVKQDIDNRLDNLREELLKKESVNDSIIDIYTKNTRTDSTNYKNWLKLYHVYTKTRKSKLDQLKILNKCISLNKNSPLVYVLRGDIYYDMSDYKAAEKDGLNAIKLNPYYPKAQLLLANIKLSTDDKPAALDFLNTVKDLGLNDNNTSFLHTSQGFLYMSDDDYAEAIKSAEKAIEKNGDNEDAYRVIGGVYYKKEEYNLALTNYTKAIEINNRSKKALVERGNTYYELNQYENAMSDYKKALELDINYASAYNGVAIINHSKEEYDLALTNYTKAIAIDSNTIYFSNRGNVFNKLIQPENAIKDYKIAIKLDPNNSSAYNGLALQYGKLENYETALDYFNNAIEKDSSNMLAHRNKGNLFKKKGENLKAIENYNKALNIQPNNSYTLELRGDAFSNLNKYKEALSDYREAKRLNPKAYSYLNINIKHLETLVENTLISSLSELDIEDLKFTKLSFYPNNYLVEQKIKNPNGRIEFYKFYITDNSQKNIISNLNGTKIPIYKLNGKLPINLTNENIKDYVNFFFQQSHGQNGSFQSINSIDDIYWNDNINSKELKKAKKYVINALKSLPKKINNTDSGWKLKMLFNFKNSLFISTVNVSRDGDVSLVDEELLYEEWEIPCKLWHSQKGYYYLFSPTNTTLLDLESEILTLNEPLFTSIIPLSFYPGYKLKEHEIKDQEGEKYKYYIVNSKTSSNIKALNGKSQIIHDTNDNAPITLTDKNISEYIEFFCYHVHAEEGAFQIINSVDDIIWDYTKESERIEKYKKKIIDTLAEIDNQIKKEDKSWIKEVIIHYGHTIFKAKIKVDSYGNVAMLDDEALDSDLPTKVLKVDGEFYRFKTVKKEDND